MPTPKNHHPRNSIGRLGQKSSSFHGQNAMSATQLRRPRTDPDLLSHRHRSTGAVVPDGLPRHPPKMLLKVTGIGSVAPVQVLMKPESTVGDLLMAALQQYVKEGRRPILTTMKANNFDLHYSQFSLESLDREEKLIDLGSRNFFMCPSKPASAVEGGGGDGREGSMTTPFSSCGNEVGKVKQGSDGDGGFGWFKFMHFLLP